MNDIKLTARQQEVFQEIKDKWISSGKGIIIKKENSLVINNLRRNGLVEIYPAHKPMKGWYQSWEAFPSEEYR